jgi:hypothetical protein
MFAANRGHCKPVILSDSGGHMTLLSGTAAFEACLAEKGARIPAVIVKTDGEADNLMFALQSAGHDEGLDAVSVGAAIVRLVDCHGVTRKQIAESLGKSPAWINRMENLSRKLAAHVQKLVSEGEMPPRSAQEIARLPDEVQTPFAISAIGAFLSKENIVYLVSRYLNEDTGPEERERIIRTPRLALPEDARRCGRMGKDNSDSARLSRAIARCLDETACLLGLLDSIDINQAACRASDVIALRGSLAALQARLSAFFPRAKT